MAWNRSSGNGAGSRPPKQVHGGGKGLVAGIAIVVMVGGVCSWLLLRSPRSSEANEAAKPQPKENRIAAPVEQPAEAAPAAEEPAKDPHEGMRLASNGVWMPKNRPYLAGRTKVFPVKTNSLQRFKGPRIARNATESVLISIFSRERGDMPLPLPRLPDSELKRIAEILAAPTPASAEDGDDTLLAKDILITAKREMAEYVKQGGDPQEFLSYYHDELERSYQLRREAQDLVNQAARDGGDGDPEVLKLTIDKYNEKLEAQGIRPLDYPVEVLKYLRENDLGDNP